MNIEPHVEPGPLPEQRLSLQQVRELEHTLAETIFGEVRFDTGSRGLYSSDASNYRQVPIGVVIPRTLDDVVDTVRICRAFDVPILSRGGGTSLAGQVVNVGIVMDFSKYVNQILELDTERRLARVQPGLVLDDLRVASEAHGLTYGPDPATHNRCTIGGMLGNDSCGVHSVLSEFYGPGARTDQNVEELEVLTYDGLRMRVGQTSDEELAQIIAQGGRRSEIYRQLRDLRDRYAPLIRARFPDIPRRVSGYNLPALLPENGFDVAKALVGSESTCATFLEATLNLVPHLGERVLLLIGYPSVYAAGDHIPQIRELKPVGCEGIDDRLVDFISKKQMRKKGLDLFPRGRGWLMVEFGAESKDEAEQRAREAMRQISASDRSLDMRLLLDDEEQEEVWEVRESGLGATAFVPGQRDAWPGWEDSAVPPHEVGRYLRDLRSLFDEYDYQAAVYGHFGQGCIHCRINFDLSSDGGLARYRAFTRQASELVLSYGGSLSGEHGDGQSRGELLPLMFGEELVQAFREFKHIWDPRGRMNPHKVVTAPSRTEDLRLGEGFHPMQTRTYFSYPEDGGDFGHTSLRCVGVGKCRRTSGGTMCPSYMVTHEEKHTTRGRAHLLYEMMQGDLLTDGWKSEEVKDSLDLCLSCKGCKGDCPVNVDMATYKAEFLAHYYQDNRRPRQAYAFGLIHHWARLASHMPRLVNLVTQTRGLSSLAKALAGMAPQREIPPFARQPFTRWFKKQHLPPREGKRVILWPDTFNNYFFPETLAAGLEVLDDAHCQVIVPTEPLCCGRPLYDYGMLEHAKKHLLQILDALGPEIDAGVPLVGLEPSCVATFRDELSNILPDYQRAHRLAEQTFTFEEFLENEVDGYDVPKLERQAVVHGHCHHKAVMHMESYERLLSRMGLSYRVLDSGCCGMAGSFGFERGEKYRVSMEAGERVLLPAVRQAPYDSFIIADGFSCREQIQQSTDRRALHLAEVIQLALHQELFDETRLPERIHDELRPVSLDKAPPASPAALIVGAGFLASAAAFWAWSSWH